MSKSKLKKDDELCDDLFVAPKAGLVWWTNHTMLPLNGVFIDESENSDYLPVLCFVEETKNKNA